MPWPRLPSDPRSPGPRRRAALGRDEDAHRRDADADRKASFELSRRHFLAALAVPVIAGAGACGPPSQATPYVAVDFRLPRRSTMGLFPAADYAVDFADLVTRGFRELGVSVAGKRVLLKPNMVEYEPGTAINTHPLLVAGAAVACRRAGAADVVVAEGPGHRRDIEYLITSNGLYDQLKEHKLRFVDLNHDDVHEVALRSWFTGMRSLALPVELARADFIISMPKLKTHHWAGMTCSMKNLFGVLPGAVYGWPKNILHVHGIQNSILDLNTTVRPSLTIVDAVTAMEGDGPIMGKPRALGFVAIGTDFPAVDATCARIIGLDPQKIEYLAKAGDFLGNIDDRKIEQRGELPSRYATRFDVIPALEGLRLDR
jgi:uncharacterized protein (DUF362 family)